jgi:hypothetical protein
VLGFTVTVPWPGGVVTVTVPALRLPRSFASSSIVIGVLDDVRPLSSWASE